MKKGKKETKKTTKAPKEPTIKPADIDKVLDDHGEDYKCRMKDGTIKIVSGKIVSGEIVPKELLE